MSKHTETAGKLPNGSIDFDKVHSAARAGKDNIFKGAVTHERHTVPKRKTAEQAEAPASAAE